MERSSKNNSGNAMVIGLVVVALVAAIAAFLFFARVSPPVDALPEVSEAVQSESTQPDIATDEAGNAVPMTETTDTLNSSSVDQSVEATAEKVTIDVAKATSIRAIGNPSAPIKIIEYASMTCSHCAHFHNDVLPELKSKYIDTGKVYLEFREFPLNDPALKATMAARCLPEDKYDGFISLLFKTQDHWAGGLNYVAALKQNAKLAGMSDATFDACQESAPLKHKIAENMQEAKDKWEISATPTFIINDGKEKISGAQPLAEFERVFRKVTNNAVGEAPAVE